MELDECILGRRAVRQYLDKIVSEEFVSKILEAGVWAPSGVNKQPWKFIVISDKKAIKALSEKVKSILLGNDWANQFKEMLVSDVDTIFYGAPLLILICIERDDEWRTVRLLDTGLASQNMMLKAYDLGLGSCFIGFGNFLNSDTDFLEEYGVPKNHELVAPLIFGYSAENPQPKTREIKILKKIPAEDE